MILVIDNYDSFTYNLVQLLGTLGAEPLVRRNDEVTLDEVTDLAPAAIVVSPGPGRPEQAGVSVPLIRTFSARVPILGVCLGHQAVGVAFGAKIVRAERVMHGKRSTVMHTGSGILAGLPPTFEAMRYHSLVIAPQSVPPDLVVTAWTAGRPSGSEIMGFEHRTLPVFGVQFHPESIGTDVGRALVANFVARSAPSVP
ncbi:MAG TPA: aminodeoxychorismate/anthranilate synthase component II [Gemmatimonadales bacterium]